jgi:Amt family ammonium transporter
METNLNYIYELQFAMDTFYFLVCGALVMWMAAGFAMLEAGLVRAKNTTEILTKNVALFAVACTMYLVCGYEFMYGGGFFLSGVTTVAQMDDAAITEVLAASAEEGFDGGSVYAGAPGIYAASVGNKRLIDRRSSWPP